MANLDSLYGIYYDMKRRCYDEKYLLYDGFGKKGVAICSSWLDNRDNFFEWANSIGYKKGMRIRLIDKTMGYRPNNCYFEYKVEKQKKESRETKKKYRDKNLKNILNVEKYIDSSLYKAYYSMLDRCNNPKNKAYKWYGGRNIKVCNEWSEKVTGFESFVNWAINNGWKKGLSIDRIDVNGDYRPTNCRWITWEEQRVNKTNSLNFVYKGKNKNLSEIAKDEGVCYSNLYRKIMYDNYSIEDAVEYLLARKRGKDGSMYHSKHVAQIGENGEIIEVFPSAKATGDFYNKAASNLGKACREGTKWIGKKWRYITDTEYNDFLRK